jgi:hypothetical protein
MRKDHEGKDQKKQMVEIHMSILWQNEFAQKDCRMRHEGWRRAILDRMKVGGWLKNPGMLRNTSGCMGGPGVDTKKTEQIQDRIEHALPRMKGIPLKHYSMHSSP